VCSADRNVEIEREIVFDIDLKGGKYPAPFGESREKGKVGVEGQVIDIEEVKVHLDETFDTLFVALVIVIILIVEGDTAAEAPVGLVGM
jgi:hypothetical protein